MYKCGIYITLAVLILLIIALVSFCYLPDPFYYGDPLTILFFFLSFNIFMMCILTYIKKNIYYDFITSIMFYLCFIILFVLYCGRHFDYYDDEDPNETGSILDLELIDKYERFNRTYRAIPLENFEAQNKLVYKSVIVLDNSFIDDYFYKYYDEFAFRELIIDCDISEQNLFTILRCAPNCFQLSITDKCKSYILNSKKIYTREMELLSVFWNSRRLLINETCRSILESACLDCKNLKVLSFPNSVVEIGDDAFKYCINLKRITFNNYSRLRSIGSRAFMSTDIRNVRFPISLNKIGSQAFDGCRNLRKVFFPDGTEMMSLNFDIFPFNQISFEIPTSLELSFPNEDKLSNHNMKVSTVSSSRIIITFNAK